MKFADLTALYHQPLFDLIWQSRAVHLEHWRGEEVQRCSLLSIKTGGCSEDCAYCAQSAHYSTGLEREELLSIRRQFNFFRRQTADRKKSGGRCRSCLAPRARVEHRIKQIRTEFRVDWRINRFLKQSRTNGPVEVRGNGNS